MKEGDPFQGLRAASCLTLGNELSEERSAVQERDFIGKDCRLQFHFSLPCTGEGNGNLPQCSCLDNPRDGGALWASVYGVAQSRTRLKWLSSSQDRGQEGEGNGENCSAMWLTVSGFMVIGLVSGLSLASLSELGSFLGAHVSLSWDGFQWGGSLGSW